jgi:hypothetical protein
MQRRHKSRESECIGASTPGAPPATTSEQLGTAVVLGVFASLGLNVGDIESNPESQPSMNP